MHLNKRLYKDVTGLNFGVLNIQHEYNSVYSRFYVPK